VLRFKAKPQPQKSKAPKNWGMGCWGGRVALMRSIITVRQRAHCGHVHHGGHQWAGHELIAPVPFRVIPQINSPNRLKGVNMPAGLNGFVAGCTNLANHTWPSVTNFISLTTAQMLFVPALPLPTNFGAGGGDPTHPGTNPHSVPEVNVNVLLHRLRFPYASISWPQRSIRSVASQPMHESVILTP
jgi:hypothetical protein